MLEPLEYKLEMSYIKTSTPKSDNNERQRKN